MVHWREVLFSIMDRNSTRGAVYFAIPAKQVIEIGTEIEI
jgi:KUP system potassium uptake protein